MTHTYVTLDVAESTYEDICRRLEEHDDLRHRRGSDGEIDMHGLAVSLAIEPPSPPSDGAVPDKQ